MSRILQVKCSLQPGSFLLCLLLGKSLVKKERGYCFADKLLNPFAFPIQVMGLLDNVLFSIYSKKKKKREKEVHCQQSFDNKMFLVTG